MFKFTITFFSTKNNFPKIDNYASIYKVQVSPQLLKVLINNSRHRNTKSA